MSFRLIKKWLSHMITFVLFIILVCMLFLVVMTKASGGEPEIFGYQLKTVLSGSMEPDIQTGSIIAVKPGGDMTRFDAGDVITFVDDQERLITHRIVDVIHSGDHVMYETKGDNNDSADKDLVLSDNVVAEYEGFTIPYLGYIVNLTQSREGSALLLILPGVLLLGYAISTIWQAIKQVELKGTRKNEKDTLQSPDVKTSKHNGS